MANQFEFKPEDQVLVYDDVKIEFYNGPKGEKKLFHFWLHTSFVSNDGIFTINKLMTEDVLKDKKHKKYDKNFQIKVQMSRIPQQNVRMEPKLRKVMPRKLKKSKKQQKEAKKKDNKKSKSQKKSRRSISAGSSSAASNTS